MHDTTPDQYRATKEVLPRLTMLRRLRGVYRFNCFPCSHPHDLAQHHHSTALTALMICDDINTDSRNAVTVDTLDVLRKSLVHDVDELYQGDIPWPMKHIHGLAGAVEKATDPWREEFWGGWPYQGSVLLHDDAFNPKPKSLEGAVINLADMMDTAMYCWDETLLGNTALLGIFFEAIKLSHLFRKTMMEKYKVKSYLAWAINYVLHREYSRVHIVVPQEVASPRFSNDQYNLREETQAILTWKGCYQEDPDAA